MASCQVPSVEEECGAVTAHRTPGTPAGPGAGDRHRSVGPQKDGHGLLRNDAGDGLPRHLDRESAVLVAHPGRGEPESARKSGAVPDPARPTEPYGEGRQHDPPAPLLGESREKDCDRSNDGEAEQCPGRHQGRPWRAGKMNRGLIAEHLQPRCGWPSPQLPLDDLTRHTTSSTHQRQQAPAEQGPSQVRSHTREPEACQRRADGHQHECAHPVDGAKADVASAGRPHRCNSPVCFHVTFRGAIGSPSHCGLNRTACDDVATTAPPTRPGPLPRQPRPRPRQEPRR